MDMSMSIVLAIFCVSMTGSMSMDMSMSMCIPHALGCVTSAEHEDIHMLMLNIQRLCSPNALALQHPNLPPEDSQLCVFSFCSNIQLWHI